MMRRRLYEGAGFRVCNQWMDKAWLRDAERGRPGKPRRVLLAWRPDGAADGGPQAGVEAGAAQAGAEGAHGSSS